MCTYLCDLCLFCGRDKLSMHLLNALCVCVCVCMYVCHGVVQPLEAITKGPNESFVHVSGVSDDFGRAAADKTLSTEHRARTKGKQLCFTLALPHLLSASLSHSVSLSPHPPPLPFYLSFLFPSIDIISLIFYVFISDDSFWLPLFCFTFSVRAFLSVLLVFVSFFFIPYFFILLTTFFSFSLFLFVLENRAHNVGWWFVDLFLKERVKVNFFLSFFLPPPLFSLSLLFHGWDALRYPNSHTTSSNVMAALNWNWVRDCIWHILCCSCSKFQAQWRNNGWVLKAGVVATWPSVRSLFSSRVRKAEALQPLLNPNSLYNDPLNPEVTSQI